MWPLHAVRLKGMLYFIDTFCPPPPPPPHRLQSQALPRHMRRRTASHKPRRMPVALKISGKKGRERKHSRSRNATPGRKFAGKESETNQDVPSGAALRHVDGKDKDGSQKLESGAGVVAKNTTEGAGPMRCRKHRRRPRAMLEARSPHAENLGEESRSRYILSYFCNVLKWSDCVVGVLELLHSACMRRGLVHGARGRRRGFSGLRFE